METERDIEGRRSRRKRRQRGRSSRKRRVEENITNKEEQEI